MYLHKTPIIFNWLYPSLLWKVKTNKKEIYLTFDDGPIPEVTPWVLDQLQIFNAKATFFCIGENVKKNHKIFNSIIDAGHSIGNHTYNHINGWRNSNTDYLANYELANTVIDQKVNPKSLFRPPYGKIKRQQIKKLHNCEIVMWDVLSGDFDQKSNPQIILRKTIQKTNKGSIVVFHDNVKAFKNLKKVLPQYLEHFSGLGFKFVTL